MKSEVMANIHSQIYSNDIPVKDKNRKQSKLFGEHHLLISSVEDEDDVL